MGALNETSKTAIAMPVQMVRALVKRLSRIASKPHPAKDPAKALNTTRSMPTL
jgi:hypothetical protein